MNGRVTSISGATVCVDLPDLKIGDRVFVGDCHLTGEVVRLDRGIATDQVFEDNLGITTAMHPESKIVFTKKSTDFFYRRFKELPPCIG